MCGIVGYIGKRDVEDVLLNGLKQLEYRGYDSSGMAVLYDKGKIKYTRAVGKVAELEKKLHKSKTLNSSSQNQTHIGIAHTRWATHGKPAVKNAHPHKSGNIFIVHNGIIENYQELKDILLKKGYKFLSDTDSEVLAHLINYEYKKYKDLRKAVRHALLHVRGAYALVAISADNPTTIVAARMSSPLVLGVGKEEYILASDAAAIVSYTKRVIYLEDKEVVEINTAGHKVVTLKDKIKHKDENELEWDEGEAKLAGYPHFMLKEIFEQPQSIADSMRGRLDEDEGNVNLGGLIEVLPELKNLKRLTIIGCGTARCAALVGQYMLEEYAKVPVEVDYAHEFRYRKTPIDKDTAVLAISQSGETADTLAAIKKMKKEGALTLGIVNVVGSSIARETDAGVYNHAGPEIAVASTKAYTSQITILALLTVLLGRQRGMTKTQGKKIVRELRKLPKLVQSILDSSKQIQKIAKKYKNYENFFYLGRKYNFPTATEGSIKLKELTYVHAEGEAAGELKHGPIAMIDKDFPSIFIVPKDSVYEKTLSGMEEVRARGGKIIAITTQGCKEVEKIANDVIYIPKTLEMLTPILAVIPLQLFAYFMAVARGRDVDKPRNLAKSVTVE